MMISCARRERRSVSYLHFTFFMAGQLARWKRRQSEVCESGQVKNMSLRKRYNIFVLENVS